MPCIFAQQEIAHPNPTNVHIPAPEIARQSLLQTPRFLQGLEPIAVDEIDVGHGSAYLTLALELNSVPLIRR